MDSDTLLDLTGAELTVYGNATGDLASMLALIQGGDAALDRARQLLDTAPDEAIQPLGNITLLAPLPCPPRLRDAGMFLEHGEAIVKALKEMAISQAPDPDKARKEIEASGKFQVPQVFYERVCYYNGNHLSVVGPDAPVVWPEGVEVVDYELELGVVVGRSGFNIPNPAPEEYVFGYTLFNDWSSRDIQRQIMGSVGDPCAAKDFANSLGPCIVTRDEIPDPSALRMTAYVDGEQWSEGFTANMYHGIHHALAELSRISPLVPGEVIGSGTPASGAPSESGKRLVPGNTVSLHIEQIGTLSNQLVQGTGS